MSGSRLRFFGEIGQPAWKYAIAVPFAVLGLMQAIRDEVLAPEVAAQYRILELLPDWPWEWYALAFLAIVLALVFEGAYRAVRRRVILDQRCFKI